MLISLCLFIISILYNIVHNANTNFSQKYNYSLKEYYDSLFNSIESDNYNLSLIYNYPYNSIKIKHKSNRYKNNKIVCVLGILVNENGIKIADSMLKWLILEYDVYCVYQKYPGILYEYPALRFAQWFSIKYNESIILYVHTKGAYNNNTFQDKVREVWKHEFTSPHNYLYIKLLKNNITDISLPFRGWTCTWYNGMFISNRAFDSINIIPYYKNILRHYYECLTFKDTKKNFSKIRYYGVLNDSISDKDVLSLADLLGTYFRTSSLIKKEKYKKLYILGFIIGIVIVIILLKILNRTNIKKKLLF